MRRVFGGSPPMPTVDTSTAPPKEVAQTTNLLALHALLRNMNSDS
ncbi:hypothetical protein [Nostoc sp.]